MSDENQSSIATTDRKSEPETEAVPATETATGAEKTTETEVPADAAPVAPGSAAAAADDAPASDAADAPAQRGMAGAAAIVGAGLGLTSLTGSGLGDMLQARQQLIGQIDASISGGPVDQVDLLYGAPWHLTALVNGGTALVAILVGILAMVAAGPRVQQWVKAVALAGVFLGAIGALVAGGMYLDLLAPPPVLPAMPTMGG